MSKHKPTENLHELTRMQLLSILGSKINPSRYQEASYFPTPVLRALVTYFDAGGTDADLAKFLFPIAPQSLELTIETEVDARKFVDMVRPEVAGPKTRIAIHLQS